MTAADLEALIERWRAGDETAAVAYFASDGVFHEAGREPIVGREAIAAHWAPFFHGGPEWRMTVHEMFGNAGGDRYTVSYTWEIKSADGAWSGKPGCAIVHLHDGKIALWREYKG
jgi:limonene-1,2-epoxide hydrolase